MLVIRQFEHESVRLSFANKIPGGVHSSEGQEAVAVGSIRALGPDDLVSGTHRSHHHALAKGLTPRSVMAELFGKATGCTGGRGGSMHLVDMSRNFLGSNGIVGAGLGLAMGSALGMKMQGERRVAVGYFGDGGANTGRTWEFINLASLWKLPLIAICENNLYAVDRQYAEDGWRVIACSRRPERSEALNSLAARYADRVAVHGLDVTDHARIDELASSLSGVTIDLLINNAGVYADSHAAALDEIDYDTWTQSFRVNTMAPLKMAQAFLSHIEGSRQKKIVTISSKMGSIAENTSGGSYLYRSSKAAANMVTKSLSIDLKPAGVIAMVFHPGWVKTDMGGPEALITATESVSGMRRIISRLSMADSGTFLAYDGQPVSW